MSKQEKVLVYGAGGVQGGGVARKLLENGYTVHTIARNSDKAAKLQEQGITAFVGDLSDANSLVPAHEGVDKVFLLLPSDYNLERVRQYIRNTVDAAKNANVNLLVINTSVFIPNDVTEAPPIELRRELIDYVKQSGVPFIILEPVVYMENFLIPGVVSNQSVTYFVPAEQPIAWISMEDASAFGVYALKHPELAGQTLPIVGPEALTGNQLAEQFSAALNRKIQFIPEPVEGIEGALSPVVGKETATGLADLYKWIGLNIHSLPQPDQMNPDMRAAVPGISLQEWVTQMESNGFFAIVPEENN